MADRGNEQDITKLLLFLNLHHNSRTGFKKSDCLHLHIGIMLNSNRV